MKVLAGIVILLIGALAWAVFALRDARRELVALQESNQVVIIDFSNRWDAVRRSLGEQKLVNESLETNLTERARQLESLRAEIATLAEDLKRSRAETRLAHDEIAKRDSQITALEGRNVDLTHQMSDLQDAIAVLERQIAEAERRLAASEGNRQELLAELRRLQDEKLELEKQLNDLAFLREQVRKLREELTISRRLDWIRRGIYAPSPKKGAEALADMKFGPSSAESSQPSLDVELRRSGEVSINAPTNAPPTPR